MMISQSDAPLASPPEPVGGGTMTPPGPPKGVAVAGGGGGGGGCVGGGASDVSVGTGLSVGVGVIVGRRRSSPGGVGVQVTSPQGFVGVGGGDLSTSAP